MYRYCPRERRMVATAGGPLSMIPESLRCPTVAELKAEPNAVAGVTSFGMALLLAAIGK